MKNLTLIAIFTLLAWMNSGYAQTAKGTLLLGGNASYQSINDESIFSLNPNIGYFVANRFAIGLNASYVNAVGTGILALGPSVRGYFLTTERGSLFAQVGYNYVRISDGNFSESDSGYSLGLGYAVFLNSSVALELSGNYAKFGINNNNINFFGDESGLVSFNVGFQIHFKK